MRVCCDDRTWFKVRLFLMWCHQAPDGRKQNTIDFKETSSPCGCHDCTHDEAAIAATKPKMVGHRIQNDMGDACACVCAMIAPGSG